MPRRTLTTSTPLDLPATLGPLQVGPYDPTMRVAAREAARASWTPDGPVVLHLAQDRCRIEAEATGPGAIWALDRVDDLLGCADDPAGFAPPDQLLRDLHRRRPGLRMTRTGTVTDVLVPTVLGQKVSGMEQRRAWQRLVRQHGRSAPGGAGLLVAPPADALATLPYEEYHLAGIERRRAETIRFACSRAIRLEEAVTMPSEDAWTRLVAFPGVGPWTAAITLRLARGDADLVETGDYNLPHLVAWNLAGERCADDARMLDLLAPYAGHRARVTRLLVLDGRRPARRGPRMPIRRLEAI